MFSANCVNHFQATTKQGNRMAVPKFHTDCQRMEEGKERGKKEKVEELEGMKGEKNEKERSFFFFKKRKRNTSMTKAVKNPYCPLYKNEAKEPWSHN